MRLLSVLLLIPFLMNAQLTTGIVEGVVHDANGRPVKYFSFSIVDPTGFKIAMQTNSAGRFTFSAPYGLYAVSGSSSAAQATVVTLYVQPLRSASFDLIVDGSGRLQESPNEPNARAGSGLDFSSWLANPRADTLPHGFSLQSAVAGEAPGSISLPDDFTGLTDTRLALISQGAFPWTGTQFKLQGLDATDSYQPGRPSILPDVQALADIVVRTDSALIISNSYGIEVGSFLANPDPSWHAAISTVDTGSALSSNNLPQPRGIVQQAEAYKRFTRDRFEVGGPVTPWADFFASIDGQWSSQSVPVAPPDQNQSSRMLFGNLTSQIRAGPHDRIDALYSGSRLALSNWGIPAGVEALTGRRMSPEFNLPNGFPDEAENDRFNFIQLGWSHQHASGTLQVRYGYSVAHLGTWPATQTIPNQSRIELSGSLMSGSPPLETLATRPRHEVAVAWQPPAFDSIGSRHHLSAGANWELSSPRNQMTAPSDLNLITVSGAPAYVVGYNTPVNSLARVQTVSAYLYRSCCTWPAAFI